MIDQFGRPRSCGFYTGSPSYYKLKFQLYELLECETMNPKIDQAIQWVKKQEMELLLEESLTERQVQ